MFNSSLRQSQRLSPLKRFSHRGHHYVCKRSYQNVSPMFNRATFTHYDFYHIKTSATNNRYFTNDSQKEKHNSANELENDSIIDDVNKFESNPITVPKNTDAASMEDSLSRIIAETNQSKPPIVSLPDLDFTPLWYHPVDQCISYLSYIDSCFPDVPFTYTIVGTTLAIRFLMLPLYVNSQKNTSRLAHMKPEMDVLKEKMDRLGNDADMASKARMAQEMKALFNKYGCNPLKGLILPLVQLPVFTSMFFGLRRMPEIFPDTFSHGGIYWFPDLSAADPMYILPIASSITFLATVELTKDQLTSTTSATQGSIMINVFRGLAVLMVPVTLYFPSSVLCYWVTNNTFTFAQTMFLMNPSVRKSFGIWELPKKPVHESKEQKGLQDMISEYMNSNRKRGKEAETVEDIKKHNQMIESKKKTMKRGVTSRRKIKRG